MIARLLFGMAATAALGWLIWRGRPSRPLKVGPDTLRRLRQEDGE